MLGMRNVRNDKAEKTFENTLPMGIVIRQSF
jgi:hypothetical protein